MLAEEGLTSNATWACLHLQDGAICYLEGKVDEARTYAFGSIQLAEGSNVREQVAWSKTVLAVVVQQQGKLREALVSVRQAIVESRTIKSGLYLGLALVTLANIRITSAIGPVGADFSRPDAGNGSRSEKAEKTRRALFRARDAVERVYTLEGVEAETRIEGGWVLAKVHSLLGDLEVAYDMAADKVYR